MKKIVIDARLAGLKHAGIGRYVKMLIENFDKFRIQNSRLQMPGASATGGQAEFRIKTINPKIKHYTLAEQIKMPGILKREKLDLVHFPHFNVPLLYNSPFVVTIHDLLWHEQVGTMATTLPEWIYWLKYLAYRLVLRHAVLKSKAIIVPSEWVKKKIVGRFPGAEKKIHVIYEGVSGVFKGPAPQLRDRALFDKYGLKAGEFLIYTGSLYPHKNIEVVLSVMKYFPDLKFVVACARNVFWERFKQEIEKRGLQSQVVLAGFVPDDELALLYKNALAFVFPSKSEGFGLPGLEAMAAGSPVISSNAGSLPEIYGDAVLYFDPKSEEELIKNIKKVKDGEEMRKRMIILGRERVKRFSWEKCAKETMEVYESCLGV